MKITIPITFAFLILMSFSSCQKEIEKYKRPEWLSGKLYTQLQQEENLDSFAICLELSGFDTLLDASGSFTVFAPDNDAFNIWLETNDYQSIRDIPEATLSSLVRYHVVQNSWTLTQLRSLDIYGWIDKDDPTNNSPRGYKRQSLFQTKNKKYYVNEYLGEEYIVDSSEANSFRIVYSNSRKYVPFFFDEFLEAAEISPSDYEYFFDETYAPGAMHFSDSKVITPEIYAENGIIYKIDKVTAVLPNAEELLIREYSGYSYSDFLDMIYEKARFSYNQEATVKQPGYTTGQKVDELFNIVYPDLTFNISDEITGFDTKTPIHTIRYHYGILAPTNEALNKLFDEVITSKSGYAHWPSRNSVPESIYEIIINSHMSAEPIYQSNFNGTVKNGSDDRIFIRPEQIIQKSYASNSTFIGLNEPIVPRAFSSVTGPVFLRPGYSLFRMAMEYTRVMPAIKKEGENYSFFIAPDTKLSEDSSIVVEYDDRFQNGYRLRTFDRSEEVFKNFSRNDLMLILFNHVGLSTPKGLAKKEYIPNLAGNYIVIDSENNIVTGGESSTWGFNGDSILYHEPVLLKEPSDNGVTYTINGLLSFPTTSVYSYLTSFSEFGRLLGRAGLIDSVYYKLRNVVAGEKYTIFLPTDEAIQNSRIDTLTRAELKQLLNYHFIRGDIIFTDGNKQSGDYVTLREDETSTIYSKRYSTIPICTSPDVIEILDETGLPYYTIEEAEGKTNIMVSEDIDADPNIVNYVTKGVIHIIDSLLVR